MSDLTKLLLVSVALSFASALAGLHVLLTRSLRGIAIDRPNERSLHQGLVPRTGGLAILLGTTVGLLPSSNWQMASFWAIALALASVSFVDDRYGLPAWLRFLVQIATALAALWLMADGQPWWWCVLALLATVWMTNLYNFMDGADGLAGGMGLSGFAAYAVPCSLHGQLGPAILCSCLAASCAAFLLRNYPPASIFMGDVGSTALGFLAATVGFFGNTRGLWPLWFPGLVFLPFALDATVTLLRRAARREKVWQAHREHCYQRIIRAGWTHSKTAKFAHGLMVGTGVSGVLTLEKAPHLGWHITAAWTMVLGLVMLSVDRRFTQHVASTARSGQATDSRA